MPDSPSILNLLKEHKNELLLILFLGGLLIYVYSLFSDDVALEQPQEEPDYVLQLDQVQIEDYWLHHKRWKVFGKKASIAKNNNTIYVTDVKIVVYSSPNLHPPEIDVVVTANEGTIDWEKQIVLLHSQVKMTRQTELWFQTEKAIYHYQKGVLHLPQQFIMHYLKDSIIGEELTYYVDQKKIELHQATWLE